ncbi:hypothetical protein [Dietzia sp. PP-33]|uniref:hypothetical protein n=1 Tax=Dietzia sp. PP-33 TaxID=2957500 RepID=UPI0029B79960|nr:hypothetical protein [Dietzia sp. PP-33]MDX2357448.1 hypothetical protein [Dietzia sp. PP-33]
MRATANAAKQAYAAIGYQVTAGQNRTVDIETWRVADLTSLFDETPGLLGISTPDLADLIVGIP